MIWIHRPSLLDVSTRRFTETDWDIRDSEHDAEWSEDSLSPNSV